MRVEMLRGTVYKAATLEVGRVVDVDEAFGAWMIARGKARPYEAPEQAPPEPLSTESAAPLVKSRRGRGAASA